MVNTKPLTRSRHMRCLLIALTTSVVACNGKIPITVFGQQLHWNCSIQLKAVETADKAKQDGKSQEEALALVLEEVERFKEDQRLEYEHVADVEAGLISEEDEYRALVSEIYDSAPQQDFGSCD